MVTKTDVFEPAKQYVKMLSKLIKSLEKTKPKDRLEYAVELNNCLNALSISVKGWKQWLTNLDTLQTLTIEDFQNFYPEMIETTIRFLKMDAKITKKKIDEAIIKYEKINKKEPVIPKEIYVS